MATDPADWYTLTIGAEYDDLSALDFADVMWQAFDIDRLESITIEATRARDKIRMRVLDVKIRRKKKPK
jgi:hypothetical protein